MDFRKALLVKSFKRIFNNHTLSQTQQQTQATDIQEEEIRMSINLPYIEGNSEKLWCILKSQKIRSTFYTGRTWCKLLCKPEDRVSTKDNNMVYGLTVKTAKLSTSVNLNGL